MKLLKRLADKLFGETKITVGVPSEEPSAAPAFATCPHCQSTEWVGGPSGGMSQNIFCHSCGHRAMLLPVPLGNSTMKRVKFPENVFDLYFDPTPDSSPNPILRADWELKQNPTLTEGMHTGGVFTKPSGTVNVTNDGQLGKAQETVIALHHKMDAVGRKIGAIKAEAAQRDQLKAKLNQIKAAKTLATIGHTKKQRQEAERSLAVLHWRDHDSLARIAGQLRSRMDASADGATVELPLGAAQTLLEIVWQAWQTEHGHAGGR
jgi:hypothetical protein